jgi:hypothetical protein
MHVAQLSHTGLSVALEVEEDEEEYTKSHQVCNWNVLSFVLTVLNMSVAIASSRAYKYELRFSKQARTQSVLLGGAQ